MSAVRRFDVSYADAIGDGVVDLDALATAVDGHRAADDVSVVISVLLRDEAPCHGVVGGKRVGEGGLEVVDELGRRERCPREEETLLDVVAQQHGDIPRRERDALAWPWPWLDDVPRHHADRRRRRHSRALLCLWSLLLYLVFCLSLRFFFLLPIPTGKKLSKYLPLEHSDAMYVRSDLLQSVVLFCIFFVFYLLI